MEVVMNLARLAVLLVPVLLLGSLTAFAGGDEAEATKKHIDVLVHEAGALKAEGRYDAAEVLFKRALELKARVWGEGKDAKRVPLTMEQAEKVLHGLEMGMESLKVLRREQELKALAKVANEIRERMKKARVARENRPEIQEAKRQLEILRLAFHGLREGEKREAMERMEHAIHVMELNLAGRRDEKAQAIRKAGPDREERVELLRLAAGLWEGFGHEGKARSIRELAEKTLRRKRPATEREHRPDAEEHREHLEMLHHRIDEVRQMVERLREAVRHLEHRISED